MAAFPAMWMTVVARSAVGIAITSVVVTPAVVVAVVVPATIVVAAVVAVIPAVVILTLTVMIAMARCGEYETAGAEQGNGNEQAADEFHLWSPPWSSRPQRCGHRLRVDGS
jgi:hypothetical protein